MRKVIDYGEYEVHYEIESDVDGNKASIVNVTYNGNKMDYLFFDEDDFKDMRFHCEEDFANRQSSHYLATGEMLSC